VAQKKNANDRRGEQWPALLIDVAVVVAAEARGAQTAPNPRRARGHAALLLSTAPVLWQPSMNIFRRFDAPAEQMFEFYGGRWFKQLSTINLGSGTGVARFQAGAQELKLTRRVGNRQYQPGGVEGATGLRLVTFFFSDADALERRFAEHGLPAPKFEAVRGTNGTSALVTDPDGQAVELVTCRKHRRSSSRRSRSAHRRRSRA
jgi:hypothetical protein